MDVLAPLGPVYQAGTLSGNPLATAAGLAVLGAYSYGAMDGGSLLSRDALRNPLGRGVTLVLVTHDLDHQHRPGAGDRPALPGVRRLAARRRRLRRRPRARRVA